MAKVVVFTPVSLDDFDRVSNYLLENWGVSVCENFTKQFEELCETISANPKMFQIVSNRKNIRKCVLTHQNVVYYRELAHQINIVTIFDTRQDPKKLSNLLKNV